MASGFNGMAVFTQPGTYQVTVPDGCAGVLVELFGAGGGGGGYSDQTSNYPPPVGGVGGAGAYVRGVVPLEASADTELTVVVGEGGAGGEQYADGADGGHTQVLQADTLLASADGGSGGGAVTNDGPGFAGTDGGAQIPAGGGETDRGSQRANTALIPAAAGGSGGFWNASPTPRVGDPGLNGYAIIIW